MRISVAPVLFAIAVIGVAGLGAASAALAFAQGDLTGAIDIGGGRHLYLECKGKGSPTVILESGIHDSSDPWGMTDTEPPVPSTPPVFAGVARFTRVCRDSRPWTRPKPSRPRPRRQRHPPDLRARPMTRDLTGGSLRRPNLADDR